MARLIEEVKEKTRKSKKDTHREDFYAGFYRRYMERTLREFEMNEFEKELYLKYLRGGLEQNRIEVQESSGAITMRTLEKFYGVDVASFFKGDYIADDDTISYEVHEKIIALIDTIKLAPYKSVLKDKFEWISEIFELSEIEKELITFLYVTKKNKCLEFLIDRGFTTSGNMNCFSFIFKEQVNKTLNSIIRNLVEIGLIYDDQVTTYYTRLLDDEDLNTKDIFIKHLIGDEIKPELKLKDFDHIKQVPLLQKIIKNAVKQKKKGVNILLAGFSGSGKTTMAHALAAESGCSLYEVATDSLEREISREDRLADFNTKSNILKRIPNSCILFDEAEDIFNRGFTAEGKSSKSYLNRLLENNSVPTIYTSNSIGDVDVAFMRRMNYILEMPSLTNEQKYKLWQRILKKNGLKVKKAKVEELSQSYDVQPALIANAVETTKLVDGDDDTFNDVLESIAKVVTKKIDVKKNKDFDESQYCIDIVNTDTDIEELTDKLIKTKRLDFSMCLSGASGCGKSHWAKKLLTAMGIEYIMFHPSDILSKWVGDNEQNLKNYFEQARQKKCALIIDEADSFVSERTLATHSWERSIVNEFLVQMESFKYPLICTTNLMDIMDSASYRRFLIKVKFDYMKPEHFKKAMKFFFNIDTDRFLKGVTPADFSVVKKEIEFFGDKSEENIFNLLQREVKVKKDKDIKESVGF